MELNTPLPEINLPAFPTCLRTEQEWAEHIRPDLQTGATSYISAGRKLIEAKKSLKSNSGSFTNLVTVRLGWDLDTAERWMQIAKHPVLATIRNVADSLPTSWTTLYQLSRLPPKILEKYIADGTVHAQLTCRTATALVTRNRESTKTESTAEPEQSTTTTELVTEPDPTLTDAPAAEEKIEPTQTTREETIGPNGRGEFERISARCEELEREKRQWEIQRGGFESEVEELRAKLGSGITLHHPRRLFRRALETLRKSDAPKLLEKDRRALVHDAVTDLLELVPLAPT